MNRLSLENQVRVIHALVEGNSIRSTCRLTRVAKGTVLRLLVDVGYACRDYQDKVFRKLTCQRIECDEIWAFCGMKGKNVPKELERNENYGSVWTWVATDPETKLVPSWYVGKRDEVSMHIVF